MKRLPILSGLLKLRTQTCRLYLTKRVCLSLFVLLLAACKKKPSEPLPLPEGTFAMHIHTLYQGAEVAPGELVTDAGGRKLRLDAAQFYFSDIRLKKADGGQVAVSGVYMARMDEEEYIVGKVPAGHYTGVFFDLGLKEPLNRSEPAAYAAGHCLAAQQPAMWFGDTARGYIFLNVQGYADTSALHTGNADAPFSIRLGTAAMLKAIAPPVHPFTVLADRINFTHFSVDYSPLLSDVDFKARPVIDPFRQAASALQLAGGLNAMFRP
jgi:hypothetical protein